MWVQQKKEYVSQGPSSSEQSVPGPPLISPEGSAVLLFWVFLQPSASFNKKKSWVTAHLVITVPQETSLPRTHTATHLSTHLPKGFTLDSLLMVTVQQPLLGSFAEPQKTNGCGKNSPQLTFLFPHPISYPK